jgi:hypothetical protein
MGLISVVELGKARPQRLKIINERDSALNKGCFMLYLKVSF